MEYVKRSTLRASLRRLRRGGKKPGNFALEVFSSEYTRTQQTARITLDQMGLLSVQPRIRPQLNERDYGTAYDPIMDEDPNCSLNGSESSVRARVRLRGFLSEAIGLLDRADVLGLSDAAMMAREIANGRAFVFVRHLDTQGHSTFVEQALPEHLLPKLAAAITRPPFHGAAPSA